MKSSASEPGLDSLESPVAWSGSAPGLVFRVAIDSYWEKSDFSSEPPVSLTEQKKIIDF